MVAFPAFLDTCVLYPAYLCDTLLRLAEASHNPDPCAKFVHGDSVDRDQPVAVELDSAMWVSMIAFRWPRVPERRTSARCRWICSIRSGLTGCGGAAIRSVRWPRQLVSWSSWVVRAAAL